VTRYEARVHRFLERYGQALSSGDLQVIVACWGMPAFVLSDHAIHLVGAPAEIKAFFSNAFDQYSAQGLVTAHPDLIRMEQLGQNTVSVDVRWSNRDRDGAERSSESWRYTLRVRDDEEPRIHIAILKVDEV
jgi:hypothetical protein